MEHISARTVGGEIYVTEALREIIQWRIRKHGRSHRTVNAQVLAIHQGPGGSTLHEEHSYPQEEAVML